METVDHAATMLSNVLKQILYWSLYPKWNCASFSENKHKYRSFQLGMKSSWKYNINHNLVPDWLNIAIIYILLTEICNLTIRTMYERGIHHVSLQKNTTVVYMNHSRIHDYLLKNPILTAYFRERSFRTCTDVCIPLFVCTRYAVFERSISPRHI